MMVFVSQHEEISARTPRFCVAYQAPHAVVGDGTHAVAAEAPHAVAAEAPMRSPQTDPMRSLETDPMRSPQTGARARAPRLPPVELDAEGQALRKWLPRVPHAGSEKKLQSFNAPSRDSPTLS
jgi:hypothetical protein